MYYTSYFNITRTSDISILRREKTRYISTTDHSLDVAKIFLYMVVLSRVGGKAQELQFTMNVIGVPQLDVSEVRVEFYLILRTLEIPNLDAFTKIHELRMVVHDHSQLVVE